MPFHQPLPALRLRRLLHRLTDAPLSQRDRLRSRHPLDSLHDGEYSAAVTVPYVPQFATPALIARYIHDGLHGRDDPNWTEFGAPDAETYTFWAQRACAIACVKMAVDTYHSALPRTLYDLVQECRDLGGYRLQDEHGRAVDQGWFYAPLVTLAEHNGLEVRGGSYASLLSICTLLLDGWLVAAAVTPEIGETGRLRRYDGHFVLVYGFRWERRRLAAFVLHNPSGRTAPLQAAAVIPAGRFGRAFAHRFVAFRASQSRP